MADYRRNRVAGGSYFFTVNLLDRRSDLQNEAGPKRGLREAVGAAWGAIGGECGGGKVADAQGLIRPTVGLIG